MSILGDIVGLANTGYQIAKDQALTGAQREANQFSHDEAQLAYERALQADSTKYQRQVRDMAAAGLNPMLAAGSGAGSVQSSAAAGVQPSGGDVSGSLGFLLQNKLIEAQIENIKADTGKKESETTGLDIQNRINTATEEAQVEAKRLENTLTRERVRQIDAQIDSISADIAKKIAETKNEEERNGLIVAQRLLANAQARQITELLPYQKQLTEAQTTEAKNAALLSAAHAAYQNGLLSSGYLDAFVKSAKAEANTAESESLLADIKQGIRTGNFRLTSSWSDQVPSLIKGLTIFLDNLNPLSNIFK